MGNTNRPLFGQDVYRSFASLGDRYGYVTVTVAPQQPPGMSTLGCNSIHDESFRDRMVVDVDKSDVDRHASCKLNVQAAIAVPVTDTDRDRVIEKISLGLHSDYVLAI